MSRLSKACIALFLFVTAELSLAMPITDTVVVDGIEWAQVDLFNGVSWSELNAVCPAGACGSGSINDLSLAGWTWASMEDVNLLFNYYLQGAGVSGSNLLGPGPDTYSERGADWDDDFISAGWRSTYAFEPPYFVAGITSDSPLDPLEVYVGSIVGDFYYPRFDIDIIARVSTASDLVDAPPPVDGLSRGAWLFKAPNSEIPLPSSLILMLAGIVLLVRHSSSRQKAHA
jgi:hypothetical protein